MFIEYDIFHQCHTNVKLYNIALLLIISHYDADIVLYIFFPPNRNYTWKTSQCCNVFRPFLYLCYLNKITQNNLMMNSRFSLSVRLTSVVLIGKHTLTSHAPLSLYIKQKTQTNINTAIVAPFKWTHSKGNRPWDCVYIGFVVISRKAGHINKPQTIDLKLPLLKQYTGGFVSRSVTGLCAAVYVFFCHNK